MNIEFKLDHNRINHDCIVERKGDWLIFTCPSCPSFERRWNVVTNEMKHSPSENPSILHHGTFVPIGLEDFQGSLN